MPSVRASEAQGWRTTFKGRRRRPVSMARNYKQFSFVQVDDLGSSGAPVPIAKIMKQQGQMTSAWIKNVRISVIVQDITASGTPVSDMPLNFMFYATTDDTVAPNDANVIAAWASPYGGGTGSLSINRKIVENEYDETSGDGAICIWAECTDATLSANIEAKTVLETWGRWHKVTTE